MHKIISPRNLTQLRHCYVRNIIFSMLIITYYCVILSRMKKPMIPVQKYFFRLNNLSITFLRVQLIANKKQKLSYDGDEF